MMSGMMPKGAQQRLFRNASTARKRSTVRLMIPIPKVVFPASSAGNSVYEPAFGDQVIGIYFR
ncbi:MAG: hypothetical protein WCA42_00180, partial [Desulfobacterales bacterium]